MKRESCGLKGERKRVFQRIVITECSNAFRRRVTMLEPRQAEVSVADPHNQLPLFPVPPLPPDCGEQADALVGEEASAWFGVGGLQLIEFEALLLLLYGAVAPIYGGPPGPGGVSWLWLILQFRFGPDWAPNDGWGGGGGGPCRPSVCPNERLWLCIWPIPVPESGQHPALLLSTPAVGPNPNESAEEVIEPNGDRVCDGNNVFVLRNTLFVFLRFFHLALVKIKVNSLNYHCCCCYWHLPSILEPNLNRWKIN